MSRRLTDRERMLRAITEKVWTQQVVDMGRTFGWKIHHSLVGFGFSGKPITLQGHKGLPDLLMVKPPRVVFMELKRQAVRELTPEQEEWIALLKKCPSVEVYIFRPGDVVQVAGVLSGRPVEGLEEGQRELRLAEVGS